MALRLFRFGLRQRTWRQRAGPRLLNEDANRMKQDVRHDQIPSRLSNAVPFAAVAPASIRAMPKPISPVDSQAGRR